MSIEEWVKEMREKEEDLEAFQLLQEEGLEISVGSGRWVIGSWRRGRREMTEDGNII